jgi:23S rRNA pseudouridine1911/1915/1917 synthase
MQERKYTLRLTTTSVHAGHRLDEVLAEWLTAELRRSVSKAKVRKLLMAGVVYVNGRPVRVPPQLLAPGTKIEARIDVAKLFGDSPSRDKTFELTAGRILFEDEDLIVVDKPSGLPAHPTLDPARDNLFAALGRFLSKREGARDPYIGVHQRLDRDTSGIVLFTKSKRVNAAIGELFSKHGLMKMYQALTVPGSVKREWTIKNYLGKVGSRSKQARYGAVSSGGGFAETAFRVIGSYERGIHLEARPKTGRTHQIRVHLSEYGLPILGDDLYGGAHADRLMLHAHRLIFPHPITRDEVSIESPPPEDFQQCLTLISSRYSFPQNSKTF